MSHRHSWQHLKGSRFDCRNKTCNIVSDIDTIVANAVQQAELVTTLDIYSQQLYDGDLKKPARDRVLAWVRQHNPKGLTIDEVADGQLDLIEQLDKGTI